MEKRKTSRREFAGSLALAAAAPLLIENGPAAAQPASAEAIGATTQALLDVARARYGKHLSEEQWTFVRRAIERGQRNADLLRQIKLHNGDEPAFGFVAELP